MSYTIQVEDTSIDIDSPGVDHDLTISATSGGDVEIFGEVMLSNAEFELTTENAIWLVSTMSPEDVHSGLKMAGHNTQETVAVTVQRLKRSNVGIEMVLREWYS